MTLTLAWWILPSTAWAQSPAPTLDQTPDAKQAAGPAKPVAPSVPSASRRQRYLGFGPRLGLFWGFGAGLRVGAPQLGLDLSGGYVPLTLFNYRWPTDLSLDGAHTGQLNLAAYLSFRPMSQIVVGLTSGYRYNSLLGHGFCFGIDTHVNFGNKFALHLGAGPAIFPAGDDNYRREMDEPDLGFGFPRPAFQFGTGTGLLYFP
ncbi:MAG: hypothetical protein DRI90_01440 [Deltaproteobacteria bacterium]|nr:MAG: hypothetical protein DRI90_01440 [Deltaproteobacteria bacterium]